MDFKNGEPIIEKVVGDMMTDYAKMLFEPLASKAIKRFMRMKDSARAKMME
jgi:hypothetical protein